MLNLEDLRQLVAFYKLGTLSKVAEEFHISQPTITRTMQRLEETFGVSLFMRGKNRIELNETGNYAAQRAKELLQSSQNTYTQVRAFDAQLHTVTVASCAPAPLWSLLPTLSEKIPEKTISSKLCDVSAIAEGVQNGVYSIGILPYRVEQKDIVCVPYLYEALSVCVPRGHDLAERKNLTLQELNGFNCLLASNIGFWNELVQKKMPSSRFLVQTDDFAFRELVRESNLPCFSTNLADTSEMLKSRIAIPISDAAANVTYYIIYPSHAKQLNFLQNLHI